jgi:hypothetical protein
METCEHWVEMHWKICRWKRVKTLLSKIDLDVFLKKLDNLHGLDLLFPSDCISDPVGQ